MIDQRLLKFGSNAVNIDDQTAIGIDLQGYDIKDPGRQKTSVSNNFTIPLTANNHKLIGFAGSPSSVSNIVYNPIQANYWNGNRQLIKNGRARVTEVNERISLILAEKPTFWDDMSDLMWPDFLVEFVIWMQNGKSLPSATTPFVGTFQDFIAGYINTTEGLFLPFYIGNLSKHEVSGSFLENTSQLWIKQDSALGGHFSIYCKTIFEFIEYKYGVDLSVASLDYDYNIFQDTFAKAMYVPARNISIEFTGTGYYFSVNTTGQFLPETNAEDKAGKSLLNFAKSFFNIFNCLIDKVSFTDKYVIRRFDDISNAPVYDFSEGYVYKETNRIWTSFKPQIDQYKQVGYIKYSNIYEGGDELTASKKIICNNKNLDAGGTDNIILSVDAYIPGQFVLGGDFCPDMSASESFKTFTFFVSQGNASTTVKASESGSVRTASIILKIARVYNLASEYTTLNLMVSNPKVYTLKKYIHLNELDKLVFFQKYYVRELNGYFFLNKISGFNPQKSNEPTTIELIKLP